MALNPLNFFEVGSQIGAVNSPAYGPAQMIRDTLQQAQKKGLIKTQSDAQLEQAKQLAQFKGGQTKNVIIANPETGKEISRFENLSKGDQVKLPTIKTPEDPSVVALRKKIMGSFSGTQQGEGYTHSPDEIERARSAGAVGFDTTQKAYVDAQGIPIQL